MGKGFTITGERPDDKLDHLRAIIAQSTLDGVARWPDGTPRNGKTVRVGDHDPEPVRVQRVNNGGE